MCGGSVDGGGIFEVCEGGGRTRGRDGGTWRIRRRGRARRWSPRRRGGAGIRRARCRGVVEELKELVEEGLGDREGLRGVAVGGEGVSDDGFLAFVDAEGEAADAAAFEGDKAGEDAGVEILEEELGGALIVPAKALLPEARLGFEQRAQLTRGKMTQVEDFELGRDGHTLFEVLEYELIGILRGWARDGGGVSGSLLLRLSDFEAEGGGLSALGFLLYRSPRASARGWYGMRLWRSLHG